MVDQQFSPLGSDMFFSLYKFKYNPITVLWRNLILPHHVLIAGPDLVILSSIHKQSVTCWNDPNAPYATAFKTYVDRRVLHVLNCLYELMIQ